MLTVCINRMSTRRLHRILYLFNLQQQLRLRGPLLHAFPRGRLHQLSPQQQLPHHLPAAIHVALHREPSICLELWGHVGGGADPPVPPRAHGPGQPEVAQLDVPTRVQEDIAALDVAVHVALAVQTGQGQQNLLGKFDFLLLTELPLHLVQLVVQGPVLGQLGHQGRLSLLSDGKAHAQDEVRVGGLQHDPGLPNALLERHVLMSHFQGDVLAQPLSPVDLAKRALSNFFVDLELFEWDEKGRTEALFLKRLPYLFLGVDFRSQGEQRGLWLQHFEQLFAMPDGCHSSQFELVFFQISQRVAFLGESHQHPFVLNEPGLEQHLVEPEEGLLFFLLKKGFIGCDTGLGVLCGHSLALKGQGRPDRAVQSGARRHHRGGGTKF